MTCYVIQKGNGDKPREVKDWKGAAKGGIEEKYSFIDDLCDFD